MGHELAPVAHDDVLTSVRSQESHAAHISATEMVVGVADVLSPHFLGTTVWGAESCWGLQESEVCRPPNQLANAFNLSPPPVRRSGCRCPLPSAGPRERS
jgi:hypothetical protein